MDGHKGAEAFDLQYVTRTPPTLGAKPPYKEWLSHKWFGDCRIHLEFRNLGGPTNSGIYIQDRYEANINEMYGRIDRNPCAGFDNCTPASTKPGIRSSRPPLDWQAMDIDFKAPRFNAARLGEAGPIS